jgi:asparagine synthase (glutamine-hydrolysing)
MDSHQPFLDEPNGLSLVFNGEIYNYIELREELIKSGYRFFTSGDTEVVLKSYLEWGLEAFSRFNGMWALAIYDLKQSKLILSRDRLGQKPLYYYRSEKCLVFASEIKSILEHPWVDKKPNYKKIYRYIAQNYRYLDNDLESYFENIFHVPKGAFAVCDLKDFNVSNYWKLNETLNSDIDDQGAIEQFKELFTDAVKLRLRSDVPVATLLSGGLDSTSVTAIASRVHNERIDTFCGITGELEGVFDESEYAKALIEQENLRGHFVLMQPNSLFETIDEMLYFFDEPICTVTWYSLYLIGKAIKEQGFKVVLNGHGGDELLAGYWDHYHYRFYDLENQRQNISLEHEIESWKLNHGRDIEEIARTRKLIERLSTDRTAELSKFPDYSYVLSQELKKHRNLVLPHLNSYSRLDERLRLELLYEGTSVIVKAEDRNMMAHSLESRSPFLDYRLVDFCFSLPGRLKIRNGLGKWLLRESMSGILPDKIRCRKDKVGFNAPSGDWFRNLIRDQIYSLINSKVFSERGIYDVDAVKQMFAEHLTGDVNHQMVLWQIINLELWFRKFFD